MSMTTRKFNWVNVYLEVDGSIAWSEKPYRTYNIAENDIIQTRNYICTMPIELLNEDAKIL